MRRNLTPPSDAARCLKASLAALTLCLFATSAHAQLSLVWTVPGASDNGVVRTYFACTNRNTSPVTVGVEVFGANGTSLNANRNYTPAEIPVAPPFQGVNLILPGEQYGDRINALDLRFGKIFRFGTTRTNIALDLYNLFNANTGTAYNQGYDALTNGATWLRPTAILNPRFVRFNVTFDF